MKKRLANREDQLAIERVRGCMEIRAATEQKARSSGMRHPSHFSSVTELAQASQGETKADPASSKAVLPRVGD